MAAYADIENLDVAAAPEDGMDGSRRSATGGEHADIECLQCKLCDKNFTTEDRLLKHCRTHTETKQFSCDYCSKQFAVKENLNVHRRSHTKERPYICTFCSRGFEHSGKLHRHMRTHTGERPHKCEICNKTFVQSGQLVIHMRAHRGEKPYTCEYCDKGFTCSKQLKVHIRIHTGEKPYECDTCGKTFGYNHVLKMHKLSHFGEKLYKCTICEEFFSSRKTFDRHLKSHSKEDATANGSKNNSSPSAPAAAADVNGTQPLDATATMSASAAGNSGRSADQGVGPPSNGVCRGSVAYSPLFSPLTPPRSPHIPEQLTALITDQQAKAAAETSQFPAIGNVSIDKAVRNRLRLAIFSTVNGDRWACPADLVIRMQTNSGSDATVDQERDVIEVELQKRLSLDTKGESEEIFFSTVVKVLEACLGPNRLHELGYPNTSIDEIIMKTLQLLGSHPCWEPSLSSLDRMKVNLRILLELCVPDPDMWRKFGWRGKSIEQIIAEVLDQC